jgi:hypothetical protein
MEQDQRLRNLLYRVFVSRNISYEQVGSFSEAQLNALFDDCSYTLLDECMDLLSRQEQYEACAALKRIVDARLQEEIGLLLKDYRILPG